MAEPEILDALIPVVKLLQRLNVPYFVTGSLASSAHGVARATLDADLVARLRPDHVESLVSGLEHDYYLDRDRVREAVLLRGSFNLIHLGTMLKIDIFVPKESALERAAMIRVREEVIGADENQTGVFFASPEDLILFKLDWYRSGGPGSEAHPDSTHLGTGQQSIFGACHPKSEILRDLSRSLMSGNREVTSGPARRIFETAGLP